MENQGIIWSNYYISPTQISLEILGMSLTKPPPCWGEKLVWGLYHPLTSCCRSTASRAWVYHHWYEETYPTHCFKGKFPRLKKCFGKGDMLVFLEVTQKRHMTYDSNSNQTAWMKISFDELWGLPEKSHGPNSPTEWGRVHSLLPRFFDDHLPPENSYVPKKEPFQKETSCSNHCFSGFQRCTCYDHVTFMSLFQPTQVKIGIINQYKSYVWSSEDTSDQN